MTPGIALSTRHLLYSDSNVTNCKNINITSLLHSLRTSIQSSGFKFQFCFIDACSNRIFGEKEQKASTISDKRVPNGMEFQHNQLTIHAAQMYGVAINNNKKGEGVFSQVLLRELSKITQNSLLAKRENLINTINVELDGISFETCGRFFGEQNQEFSPLEDQYQEPCVDRELVFQVFQDMLFGRITKHILLIQGNKLFGKSWLLKNKFRRAIPSSMLLVTLDMRLGNKIEYVFRRIINKIEEELEEKGSEIRFLNFRKTLSKYTSDSFDGELIYSEHIEEALAREDRKKIIKYLLAALFKDLKKISNDVISGSRRKIVIIIDTLNNPKLEVTKFITRDFFDQVDDLSNIVVVVCTRIDVQGVYDEFINSCEYFNLSNSRNKIDIHSWRKFVKECKDRNYRMSGDLLYESINDLEKIDNEIAKMESEVLSQDLILSPFQIMDRLQKFNIELRQNR
jgi:hypothetical protein